MACSLYLLNSLRWPSGIHFQHRESLEKAKALIGESGEDTSLNISHPSRILCQSFDYTFDGNAIRLIVPKKGVSVSKLANGSEAIWIPEDGETFGHARVYLNKDGKPELVLLVTTSSGTSKETYLELKDGKWVSCDDHDAKMKTLKVITEWISDSTIDLSASKDTKECITFETDIVGITTRHFYPKAGYLAVKVNDGTRSIWEPTKPGSRYGSEEDFDGYDYCLSCLVYRKENVRLLEMIVVERLSRRWKYFEKSGEEWMDFH
ncbi:hypothetical protein BEWA_047440 [Theileria equi strain WA]|uniref:Signal peptide containing protein n=1 Tax=Theileria equi strain WA TaxID=1537102 RepID=L1LAL3_THEEQ|nr:hypothetical protein BEWA_047440 [Theileria equi strain WA]EKX72279.1 hypothetical protein BEWA_047440 [Theileria equi strain WA]|eukprot:XP_004831731.1 hypothetical protein BEWA_047440 [Theileria equi strain WA]